MAYDARPSEQGTGGHNHALVARVALAIALVVLSTAAIAAPSPFGIATPDGSGGSFGGPLAPLFQWIALRQSEFYRTLTGALGDLKENGPAAWLLMAVSSAMASSTPPAPAMVSGENVRRGVILSSAWAFLQALSTIAIVMIGSMMLRVTRRSR